MESFKTEKSENNSILNSNAEHFNSSLWKAIQAI